MLSGTEADIINSVARLKEATKSQIRREVGFSLEYIGFLCRSLVRKGYLTLAGGRYSLAKDRIRALLDEGAPKIDRKLIKEIAGELAKEISGELKKTVSGLKLPGPRARLKAEERKRREIKIRTDFELPVEDETLALETNIDQIGARLEEAEADIDKSIELLRKIQTRRKKR